MAESRSHVQEPRNFTPKDPPKLDPPKNDPISTAELAKCDGTVSTHPTYVAIKGTVFDVSGNTAYAPSGAYHSTTSIKSRQDLQLSFILKDDSVFAGKDASRALAQSSLKLEDCRPEYDDLGDKEQTVLNDWFTFFSKRYNIVGRTHD